MKKKRLRTTTVDPFSFQIEAAAGSYFLVVTGISGIGMATRARIRLDRSYVLTALGRELWRYVKNRRCELENSAAALKGDDAP